MRKAPLTATGKEASLKLSVPPSKKLTGIWKTQRGESPIEEGTVDDKKISFSVSLGDRKISYTGELVSEKEIVLKNERGEMKLAKQ